MSGHGLDARVTGWLLSGTAAALLSGAAALALTADRRVPVVSLDLGLLPLAGPTLSALAAPPPEVADTPWTLPEPPAPEEAIPGVPAPDAAIGRSAATTLPLPEPEPPVVAELELPASAVKPKPRPKRTEARDMTDADPKTLDAPGKRTENSKAKPKAAAETPDASATASAPTAASKAKAPSTLSPAAYAKAVMKKVRATRKVAGAGKGTAIVGFSIAADGSLAGVTLLQGSGDARLDKVALDHIRRAAPFPAPPPEAGRNYSFEFVGK